MEVILLEKLDNYGNVGDIVKVKNGYARNFLIPQGIALRATNDNKVEFETRKAEIEKINQAKKDVAEKNAKKLDKSFVVLTRQAGEDGRLYGSVTSRDIAQALTEAGNEVQKNQIEIPTPAKYIGINTVKIKLHSEVIVEVYVNVARTENEAKEAEKEFLNPKKQEEQNTSEAEVPEITDEPVAEK